MNFKEIRLQATKKYLVELEQSYIQTGDGALILDAIFHCSNVDIPLPKWVQFSFLEAYRKVIVYYEAGSWDDVFGRPHPKGTHLDAKGDDWRMASAVYNRIYDILSSELETPIDAALFERVGRELGVGGKTKTENLYYSIKNDKFLEKLINALPDGYVIKNE